MAILAMDHAQIAIPVGKEALALEYYVGLLGFTQVEKPMPGALRGGAWLEAGPKDRLVKIHLGPEDDFRANKKAHVALVVDNLDALVLGSKKWGLEANYDDELGGVRRAFLSDPFGNRVEVIAINFDDADN